jgi:hypothetical protein
MLYDNALLVMAYTTAYSITNDVLYKKIVLDTASYIFNELTHPSGGFYAAQDADSEYYVFTLQEIIECLGVKDGEAFCRHYDITEAGNFEKHNIPNLLKNPNPFSDNLSHLLPALYTYRKNRYPLHKDDKMLTSWNGLMIAALAMAGRLLNEVGLINAAKKAHRFIEAHVKQEDKLYTSWREGKHGANGFLDDYAYMAWACLELHHATCLNEYLQQAASLCKQAVHGFFDSTHGGFYLNGRDNERLLMQIKETYDGAMPSGNAVMAYNLVMLSFLGDTSLDDALEAHLSYMNRQTAEYPAGHAFYHLATLARVHPPIPMHCTVVGT